MNTEGEFADSVYGSMHWKLVGQNLCLCDDLIGLRVGSAALVGSLPQDGIQRRSAACLQAQQAKSRHDLTYCCIFCGWCRFENDENLQPSALNIQDERDSLDIRYQVFVWAKTSMRSS